MNKEILIPISEEDVFGEPQNKTVVKLPENICGFYNIPCTAWVDMECKMKESCILKTESP